MTDLSNFNSNKKILDKIVVITNFIAKLCLFIFYHKREYNISRF